MVSPSRSALSASANVDDVSTIVPSGATTRHGRIIVTSASVVLDVRTPRPAVRCTCRAGGVVRTLRTDVAVRAGSPVSGEHGAHERHEHGTCQPTQLRALRSEGHQWNARLRRHAGHGDAPAAVDSASATGAEGTNA